MIALLLCFSQPEYLGPQLHGIVAYFNIVVVRRSEEGKQVRGCGTY